MSQVAVALIILAIIVVSFIFELMPASVTAMLGCFAFAVTGIISFPDALRGFSNDTVLMVVGVMIIGSALFETGAAKLLGRLIIKLVGYDEKKLLLVIVVIAGVLSAFVSNSATVAMFIPMMHSVSVASDGKIQSKHLIMPLGLASLVGGGCTLIGSTPQLIAQALLQNAGLRTFTFFEQGIVGFPVLIVTVIYFATFGYPLIKKVTRNMISDTAVAITQPDKGKINLTVQMGISLFVLIFVVVTFIFGLWTNGAVALIGALVCIATGCISQKEAYSNVSWSSIFIIAAALGIGRGLDASGAAKYLATMLTTLMGPEPNFVVFISLISLLCLLIASFLSHTSAIAVMAPILITCAAQMNLEPASLVYVALVSINIGMLTPLGAASYTMTMTEGYHFSDYFKVGWPITLAAFILTVILCLVFII
jgi:anion transporter